jgi:hypothetical protein
MVTSWTLIPAVVNFSDPVYAGKDPCAPAVVASGYPQTPGWDPQSVTGPVGGGVVAGGVVTGGVVVAGGVVTTGGVVTGGVVVGGVCGALSPVQCRSTEPSAFCPPLQTTPVASFSWTGAA